MGKKNGQKSCASKPDAAPFKVGDVVMLNSGSPLMTVEYPDGDFIEVAWFDRAGLLQEKAFRMECLSLASRADEAPF